MSNFYKKKIISKVAPVISGLQIHRLFQPFYSGMGQVLTFHRVVEDKMDFRIHNHQSLEVTPEQLKQTIQFYKSKNYNWCHNKLILIKKEVEKKLTDREAKKAELQKKIEEKRALQLKKREDLKKAIEAKRLKRIQDIEDAKKAKEEKNKNN